MKHAHMHANHMGGLGNKPDDKSSVKAAYLTVMTHGHIGQAGSINNIQICHDFSVDLILSYIHNSWAVDEGVQCRASDSLPTLY